MIRHAPPLALAVALGTALAGCAAQVSHPTKTAAEMQADIDRCSDQANRKYWMDPVAALYNAYDCLEAQGYQRGSADVAGKVEKAVGQRPAARPPAPAEPGKPCRVPCRPDGR